MFTVYKITNSVNSKYYIGVHETDDACDDYMGSGPAIKNAIKSMESSHSKKRSYLFSMMKLALMQKKKNC